MASSHVPLVLDAIVAAATAANPAAVVYDGYGITDEAAGNYLMIGIDDPTTEADATSATSQIDWAYAGTTTSNEAGLVTCAALSWNGDSSQKAARDAAFSMISNLHTATRATPALGIATLLWVRLGSSITLIQNQTDNDALCIVVFTVAFRAQF